MNRKERYTLYESLYHKDLILRESFTTRIQWSSALLLTEFTVIAYMLRTFESPEQNYILWFFITGLSVSFFYIMKSIGPLKKASWGNTYKLLPTPNEIDKYKNDLIVHNKDIFSFNKTNPQNLQPFQNIKVQMNKFMYETLRECSSVNSEINRIRSEKLHDSMKWFLISTLPLLFSCLVFIIFDLDASSPRKNLRIEDQSNAKMMNYISEELAPSILESNQLIIEILDEIQDKKETLQMSDKEQTPPQAPSQPEPRPLVEDNSPKPNAESGGKK